MTKQTINVLVTAKLPNGGEDRIKAVSDQFKLTVVRGTKPENILDAVWKDATVLFTWDTLPAPGKAPNLKWVQFQSAGIDSSLKNPIFEGKDIIITTMSGIITGQIAEYVLMMMLSLDRRLPLLLNKQKEHHWPESKEKWQSLLPTELRHSAVGILGYGSIGRQVARLVKPFGATVLAAKKDVMHPEDRGFTLPGMGDPDGKFFDRLYPIEAMQSLLRECDFVVLALPLTDSTRHILDEAAFAAMKETAYLINVGRGGLIDEKALIHALKTRQIAGAALDVFEEEPLPKDSPLWEIENLIISPHISGMSRHLHTDTLELFIENLERYLSGKPLYNQVDYSKGY